MKKKNRSSSWLWSTVFIFAISYLVFLGLIQPYASQDLAPENTNYYTVLNKAKITSQNFFQQSSLNPAINTPPFQLGQQTSLDQIASSQLQQKQQTINIEKPYKQGEVLVKFKPFTAQSTANQVMNTLQVDSVRHYQIVDVHLTRTPPGKSVEETVRQFKKNPSVEYAEPNYIWYADIIPNDPDFDLLWGLNNTGQTGGTHDDDIDAPEVWDLQTGSSDVVIAVIDTGVDYTHADLAGNMWTNAGEIPGDTIDNDGNGYVDDVHGIDSISGSGNPMDFVGHGTHCAGVIAGSGNNGIGITGVSWSSKIMALKFIGPISGNTNDAIECIEYMINMKNNYGVNVKISSNSWGGGAYSIALEDAVNLARDNDIIFIAAAGNDGNNNDLLPHYPSSYHCLNIVSVAASDHNDGLASFSCYGYNSVDVAAPGVNILSTTPGNNYRHMNGTSMATPYVAGLAALIYSHYPGMSYLGIKERLLRTVDTKAQFSETLTSGGRINAYAALTKTIQGPFIYSLAPGATSYGVEITIEGSQFGENQGAGHVTFSDNLTASVVSWSDYHIVCIVPPGCQSGPVTVTTDAGEESNGKLFTLSGSISGTITQDPGGTPLEGLTVVVYDSYLNAISYGRSNEEGHFVLGGLPTGAYYVGTSNDQEYADEFYADANPFIGGPPPVHVVVPNNTPNIDFSLSIGGSISGQITHDPTGEPLSDVMVNVSNSSYDSRISILQGLFYMSDSQGNYTVDKLPAGAYYVVTSNGYGYADQSYADANQSAGDPPPVHVETATVTPNIDFALVDGATINGVITDCEDPTITLDGITVCAYDWETDSFIRCSDVTNATGSYEIVGLATGSYKVCAQPGGVYIKKCLESPFETIAGDDYNLDLCMEVGGSISGEVDCENCSGGFTAITVYNTPDPEENDDLLKGFLLPEPGPYTLGGLPYDTEMWVYSFWKMQFVGNPVYSGSYEGNPITLIKGEPYPTDIDIHLKKLCDADADCDGICDPGESAPNCSGSDACPYDPENDIDGDSICGDSDNCPHHSNPGQEDTYPPQGNGIGDTCECEGDFDCDRDQDGSDAVRFKQDFGRSAFSDPCTEENSCAGNFDSDQDVDGMDASMFKDDFGRSYYHNICPPCAVAP